MGGSFSAGRSNAELVHNLATQHAKTSLPHVEELMLGVDRVNYFLPGFEHFAYQDQAWRNNQLHLSAPVIYWEVLDLLELSPGLSFLNLGSGTGYLSTMVSIALGPNGVNHGIELHQEVIDYAIKKLADYKQSSESMDRYDICEPIFVHGNCLNLPEDVRQYDRVYCGASCPDDKEVYMKNLIKVGGILVMPYRGNLIQIKRVAPNKFKTTHRMQVAFSSLQDPPCEDGTHAQLPKLVVKNLQELTRTKIRQLLRSSLESEYPEVTKLRKFVPKAGRHYVNNFSSFIYQEGVSDLSEDERVSNVILSVPTSPTPLQGGNDAMDHDGQRNENDKVELGLNYVESLRTQGTSLQDTHSNISESTSNQETRQNNLKMLEDLEKILTGETRSDELNRTEDENELKDKLESVLKVKEDGKSASTSGSSGNSHDSQVRKYVSESCDSESETELEPIGTHLERNNKSTSSKEPTHSKPKTKWSNASNDQPMSRPRLPDLNSDNIRRFNSQIVDIMRKCPITELAQGGDIDGQYFAFTNNSSSTSSFDESPTGDKEIVAAESCTDQVNCMDSIEPDAVMVESNTKKSSFKREKFDSGVVDDDPSGESGDSNSESGGSNDSAIGRGSNSSYQAVEVTSEPNTSSTQASRDLEDRKTHMSDNTERNVQRPPDTNNMDVFQNFSPNDRATPLGAIFGDGVRTFTLEPSTESSSVRSNILYETDTEQRNSHEANEEIEPPDFITGRLAELNSYTSTSPYPNYKELQRMKQNQYQTERTSPIDDEPVGSSSISQDRPTSSEETRKCSKKPSTKKNRLTHTTESSSSKSRLSDSKSCEWKRKHTTDEDASCSQNPRRAGKRSKKLREKKTASQDCDEESVEANRRRADFLVRVRDCMIAFHDSDNEEQDRLNPDVDRRESNENESHSRDPYRRWSDLDVTSEEEDLEEEEEEEEEEPPSGPTYWNLMRERIQALPLPNSIKAYLNYGRDF